MTSLAWTTLETPVGLVSVACSESGVASVRFGPTPRQVNAPAGQESPTGLATRADLAVEASRQLGEYFSGERRVFEVPLDWTGASRLRLQVLGTLFNAVAFGETVTYGALARLAEARAPGLSLPARAIGQLMGSNPYPLIVPCHRVVAADGLGGYSGGTGIEIKRWLLTFEGSLPPTLDWTPAGPGEHPLWTGGFSYAT
jgi:methylated-DNA-[protein]-cysteine S-methyltransferase